MRQLIRRPAPAAAVCRRWVVVVVEHWAVGSEVTREPEFRFRIADCGVGIRILQLAPDCCYRWPIPPDRLVDRSL